MAKQPQSQTACRSHPRVGRRKRRREDARRHLWVAQSMSTAAANENDYSTTWIFAFCHLPVLFVKLEAHVCSL